VGGKGKAIAPIQVSTSVSTPMAIHRLLEHSAFGPEDIKDLVAAYEAALRTLGLSERSDPLTEIVAKRIIEIAQTGIRDPAKLCALAVEGLNQ
jgi:hypothetical protein